MSASNTLKEERSEIPGDSDGRVNTLVLELARMLSGRNGPKTGERGDSNDELLLDAHIAGARYLLIRMPAAAPSLVSLSPREQEIVRMVAKGYPNKVIADVLDISSWTVCTHLRRTFAKCGVTSRAAMVAQFLKEGRVWDQAPSAVRPGSKCATPVETVASAPSITAGAINRSARHLAADRPPAAIRQRLPA
jgi:DNA-binding CsgD family transcriptional regulator